MQAKQTKAAANAQPAAPAQAQPAAPAQAAPMPVFTPARGVSNQAALAAAASAAKRGARVQAPRGCPATLYLTAFGVQAANGQAPGAPHNATALAYLAALVAANAGQPVAPGAPVCATTLAQAASAAGIAPGYVWGSYVQGSPKAAGPKGKGGHYVLTSTQAA